MIGDKTPPRRIAHVWTPKGIEALTVEGDWPECIQLGPWVYERSNYFDRTPMVLRGRYTGAEFVAYRVRRAFTCDDVPAFVAAPTIKFEDSDGNGRHADNRRSAPVDEQRAAARPDGRSRRRHLGAQPPRAAVSRGQPSDRRRHG